MSAATKTKGYCPDILSLAVNGVHWSPACWSYADFRDRGAEMPDAHVCPDHAEFDVWVVAPDTGWYRSCLEAGYEGYDGVNPALAIELDHSWLSWNGSPNSLLARLANPS